MTFTSASAPDTVARALASRTSALSKSFFNWVSSSVTEVERGIRGEPFNEVSAEVFILIWIVSIVARRLWLACRHESKKWACQMAVTCIYRKFGGMGGT